MTALLLAGAALGACVARALVRRYRARAARPVTPPVAPSPEAVRRALALPIPTPCAVPDGRLWKFYAASDAEAAAVLVAFSARGAAGRVG